LPLIFHLLKLRFLFLFRTIKSVGIIRLILLVGLVIYLSQFLFKLWQKDPVPWVVSFGFLFSILQAQISRKDKITINTLFEKGFIYWISEYLLWFFPVFILLAYGGFVFQILTIIGGIIFVSFIGFSFNLKQSFKTISLPFPVHQFEWKSGIRKLGMMMLIVYLSALIFSGFVFIIPTLLFLQLILVSTFYHDCESVQLVRIISENPTHFIFWKTLKSVQTFWVLHLPLLVLFLILHSEFWMIGISLFVWITFLQFISIVSKYAIFREKENISNLHTFLVLFTSLAPLNIMLFPIPVGMTVVLWRKSKRNLKEILDA